MRNRIPIGPLITAAGALLLLVSLFLDWYGTEGGDGVNAWKVFEVIDLLLAALAIAAIVSALRHLENSLPGPDLRGALLPASVAALLLVVSQLANHPPAAIDLDAKLGIFLALGGSALMLAGAIASIARVSLAVERSGAGSAPAGEDRPAAPPPPRPAAPGEEPTRVDEGGPPPRDI